jgi:hypothetical protein
VVVVCSVVAMVEPRAVLLVRNCSCTEQVGFVAVGSVVAMRSEGKAMAVRSAMNLAEERG